MMDIKIIGNNTLTEGEIIFNLLLDKTCKNCKHYCPLSENYTCQNFERMSMAGMINVIKMTLPNMIDNEISVQPLSAPVEVPYISHVYKDQTNLYSPISLDLNI